MFSIIKVNENQGDSPYDSTTVWHNGEQNSISSLKTLKPDKGEKLQYIRCGELYF